MLNIIGGGVAIMIGMKASGYGVDWYIKDAATYIEQEDLIPKDPGECLIFHMKRLGVTVEELSERADVGKRTIWRYRKGEISDLEVLLKICVGLHLPPIFSLDLISKAGFNLESRRFTFGRYVCLCLFDRSIDEVKEIAKSIKA